MTSAHQPTSAHPVEIAARGMTFDALVAGPSQGRPVMLLHGFPQTSWSWRHQIEALAESGYRVLAFDQRGYSSGARPAGTDAYKMRELAGDVLAVADTQGWKDFDLVGHDWGAAVAWVVAAVHPERTRTLCAVSVPHPLAFAAALGGGDGDQSERSSYIGVFRAEGGVAERLLLGDDGAGDGLRNMFAASGFPGAGAGEGASQSADDVEVYVRAMKEPGALTAALNWYRAMSAEDFAGVESVTVPTLYVWSTGDVAIGRGAAESTAEQVTGPYRFEILEGVSHWIPEDAPVAMNGFLLEHLTVYS